MIMITTHTLVLNFSYLLKDSAQQCFPLSSALEFLVLHCIIPINKRALMPSVSKTKIPWPYIFLQVCSFTPINSKIPQRRCLDLLSPIFLPLCLEPTSVKLSSHYSTKTSPSMLTSDYHDAKYNGQFSTYMTYFGDHVFQFAQDSHGFSWFYPHDY